MILVVSIHVQEAYMYRHITSNQFFRMQRNTFQVVLITDGNCSFVTCLYADRRIQWSIGDSSVIHAQAGFDAGDEMRFFTIPGSGTPDIVNIENTTNVDIPGQWTFRVDLEVIVQPCTLSITYYSM